MTYSGKNDHANFCFINNKEIYLKKEDAGFKSLLKSEIMSLLLRIQYEGADIEPLYWQSLANRVLLIEFVEINIISNLDFIYIFVWVYSG